MGKSRTRSNVIMTLQLFAYCCCGYCIWKNYCYYYCYYSLLRLCTVVTVIYLKQTMFLGYILLKLLKICAQCIVTLSWMFYTSTLVLSEGGRGARSIADDWGTALQAERSWVRFPIGIFHWHTLSGRTMALESTHPLTEMSTKNISLG